MRQFWLVGKQAEDAYRPYDFYPPFESARAAYVEGGRPGFRNQALGAFVGDRLVGRTYLSNFRPWPTRTCASSTSRCTPSTSAEIGTALVDAVVGAARSEGRRTVVAEAYVDRLRRPGSGVLAGDRLHRGDRRGHQDRRPRRDRADLGDAGQGGRPRAAGATAVPCRTRGGARRPDRRVLPAQRAFNDEAPSGEARGTEAEVWDETRVRDGEAQNRKVGRHVFAVAAIAADGTMAGLTEAIVNDHAPTRGFQAARWCCPSTAATPSADLAMKVANHQAIRTAFPQCRILMTGNAGVDAAMNAVNERLGYREVERCVEVQRDVLGSAGRSGAWPHPASRAPACPAARLQEAHLHQPQALGVVLRAVDGQGGVVAGAAGVERGEVRPPPPAGCAGRAR